MYNSKDVLFLPLGGTGEIGMNFNLYSFNGKWLIVDCGISFKRELGIDIIMPDPDFIAKRRNDLVGLVLTHAHEDHIGAIPYLWPKIKCPIYASPFTAAVVREKLKSVDYANQVKIKEVQSSSEVDIGPFNVKFINVTHSIPDAKMIAIRTGSGTIVHTGDWKIDQNPLIGKVTDIDGLKRLGEEGVLALVCDSTEVLTEKRTKSELDVRNEIKKIISEKKGKVAITCFASNVARMETAGTIAEETGRKAFLVGRSLIRINQIASQCGYLKKITPFYGPTRYKKFLF